MANTRISINTNTAVPAWGSVTTTATGNRPRTEVRSSVTTNASSSARSSVVTNAARSVPSVTTNASSHARSSVVPNATRSESSVPTNASSRARSSVDTNAARSVPSKFRGARTIELVFPTGKMKTITNIGPDGFTTSVQVPETRTIRMCEPNVMWLAHVASGNREEADKLAHDPSECGNPHYRPDRFGGKKLCGACIARIPCRFGKACNLNHPDNFPPVEDAPTQGAASGGADSASVSTRTTAPRVHRHGPARNTAQGNPNRNILMCKKELAKMLGIKLPEGETACAGGCGFAHNMKDMACKPHQKVFRERVLAGELDFQKIADELVAFWLKATVEERKFILETNKLSREPALSNWCFDQWVDFWISAASSARSNKKLLTDALKTETDEEKQKQLKAKIASINVFGLFEGEDSLEENMVWELKRCSHTCSTSYSMQMQALGGPAGVCYSSGEKDESFSPELLAELNAEYQKLQETRQECIAVVNGKDSSMMYDTKDEAMATLREVNVKLAPLEKRLAALKQRPLCPGGFYCKKGAHFDAVDDNGLLFAFDFDEVLGKRKSDDFYRSNIVELRQECKDKMDALNFERKELLKALASTSTDDKAARKDNQSRMKEVNQELEYLRKEYLQLHNKLRLFTKTETLTTMPESSCVQFTLRIPTAFSSGGGGGGGGNVEDYDLPPADGKPESEEEKAAREMRNKLRALRLRIQARKEKKANDMLRAAVSSFRSSFEEKVRKIANAATADEARTLYDNLISIRCYVVQEKVDHVSMKNRTRTADGRPVFYLDVTEDGVKTYRSDTYGVLRECEPGTALTSDSFKQMKERFNHASFKAFYGSGAFRFMSYYEYETSPVMRQALEVFLCKPRPEGWDIFIGDVRKELHRYNTMDVIETKVMKPGVWDPEDPEPFEIIQTVVSCPEKEQYNDFWSFYLKTPMVTDPKVVGTDSKLAIAEPQLFASFRESGTKLTFTAWLLAADFVPTKDEPTLEAWLNAPRNATRKHNRATYIAYKSGKFAGISWRMLKHYINIVVPVDPEMTIQTFAENEYFVTAWATSSASRNIGATNGGIPFATFATNPYEYQEFYEHGYNTRGVSFEQFLQDKKDGWILMVPRHLKKLEVLSLAWLSPELVSKDLLSNIKMQLWRVSNLSEFNEAPSKAFQLINKATAMMVPRSICDEQLFELLSLLVKKSTDASAIRNLLQQIPTTAAEGSAIRSEMISHYESEMAAKISRKRDAFIGFANTQSGFKTVQSFLSSLPTEEQVAQIHRFIDSLSKRKREQANIFFDDFLRIAKVSVPDNISAIAENIKTDVHAIQKVVQNGDEEEIKVIQPPLLEAARQYLLKLSQAQKSTKTTGTKKVSSKAVKKTDKVAPTKVMKQESAPVTASVDLDTIVERFRPDDVFFKPKAKKMQTELQKSGRVQLFDNHKLYITNIRITKEREETKTFSYWAVGPFETKAEAATLKSVVQRALKTSGVQVEKYTEGSLTVFETLIPDGADSVQKQARKWDLEGHVVSAMKQDVLNKMAELIPHISKATNVSAENISSSLIKKEEKPVEAEEGGFAFEDSDDSSVSSDDSDDSEGEVLIGREVTVKRASFNHDEESENFATQAQRSFGAGNKSKRYDGPSTREAPTRGGKGPKGKRDF